MLQTTSTMASMSFRLRKRSQHMSRWPCDRVVVNLEYFEVVERREIGRKGCDVVVGQGKNFEVSKPARHWRKSRELIL